MVQLKRSGCAFDKNTFASTATKSVPKLAKLQFSGFMVVV